MVMPSTLQKYGLFGGMLKEQIENIIPLMEEEKFKPEDLIITEGRPNDKIYFVIEGRAAVIKRDIVLAHFDEGDAFGEMEVLDIMPAVCSIKALTPLTAMSVSNKALRTIYNMDVKIFALIIMNLARDLSRRLRKMDEKLASSQPIFV